MARINPSQQTATTTSSSPKKKIFIVDDHPMMREGLRGILIREADLTICGEAENARKALEQLAAATPDLVLLDITMPGKSGLELVKDLRALYPDLKLLTISMHEESLYAERVLRAGARGYITKHQPPDELIKAIRQVLAGQIYVSREMSETLLQRFTGAPQKSSSPLEKLTDREFEVFQLLGEGKACKEIAQRLNLSEKTISVHNSNIRQKLKLQSTAQLIRFAVQSENLSPPSSQKAIPAAGGAEAAFRP